MDQLELNKKRYSLLKKLKYAYENYDFSDLFDDIADDCIWGRGKGKNEVIESLKNSEVSMKERNYWHRCTIVQVSRPEPFTELNTKPDGSGRKAYVMLNYAAGEFCMVDQTSLQTLFMRLDLSPEGKIKQYYATLPPQFFRPVYEIDAEEEKK